MYRKFGARQIFDGESWLAEDQVLITDESGKISDIISRKFAGDHVEYHEGILLPGLVNAHVHLELSHLKGAIPPGTGMVNFLLQVISDRKTADTDKLVSAIALAEEEMWLSGIIAAGDICNTVDSLAIKENRHRILWRNFIEVINLRDENTGQVFTHFSEILSRFESAKNQYPNFIGNSLVPHAPYSVNAKSFDELNKLSTGKTISIHSQESEAENELFINGTGDFLKLYKKLGFESIPVSVSKKTSLQTVIPHFNQNQTLLLVHNTAISEEDILFATAYAASRNIALWFCICPNANLYIENRLPDIRLLLKHQIPLVIGTDSYASNYQLSIGDEIKQLAIAFPEIDLSVFLKSATSNGADALGIGTRAGRFLKGTSPGIVLMDTNFKTQRII